MEEHDARSTGWTRFQDLAAFPFAVFVCSRFAIFGVAAWSRSLDPRMHRPTGPVEVSWLTPLCHWDCGWYVSIAERGYAEPQQTNFFPLLPVLMRGLSELTGLSASLCAV